MQGKHALLTAELTLIAVLFLSALHPYDHTTWFMEVAPVLIALPVMAITYRRFPLTTLLYCLIFFHALILITGGAYSYARVPLGFWMQDVMHLSARDIVAWRLSDQQTHDWILVGLRGDVHQLQL
jgi:putative membrane protein